MKVLIRKYAAYLLSGVFFQMEPLLVNAASVEEVITESLGVLYSIIAAFVTSVGVMITLWGIFEWGTSMRSNKRMMKADTFKRIVGGLVLLLAPNIIQGFI